MSAMNATVSALEVDDSSVHNENQPTSAASLSLCPLCCEEDSYASPTPGAILSTCRHRSCRACMVKWIEREEASGQARPPTCPFCRSTIIEEDVLTILGRPFEPRQAMANNPNGDDEIDELTLQWINEHTVPCGGCGFPIEKESGCDLIECLCGYRFCYGCGVAGGECRCNPRHRFLGDVFRLNDEYIPHAPIMDGSGRVDLKSCIRRREVSEERKSKRMKTRSEELGRWEYSEKNATVCTSSGRWLFTPAKDTGCILMLTQQLSYFSTLDERVRHRRSSRRRLRSRRLRNAPLNTTRDTSWLFLGQGSDIRAMQQLFFRYEVRGGRYKMKHILAYEVEISDHERELNLVWMFLPNHAGFRILRGMSDAVMKRMYRDSTREQAREEKSKDSSAIDMIIRSGAWLFQNSTKIVTQNHLARLSEHSKKAERKKSTDLFSDMVSSFGNEEQCLKSIVLVFPWQDGDE